MDATSRRGFLLSFVTVAALKAEEDVPLFRSEVALVKVDARVRTSTGEDVQGLEKSDFIVLDEGQPQPVTHFARESDPVNVILVLDISPSMRRSLAALAQRAGDALDRLRPGDRAGTLLFAERTSWNQPLTTDVKPIPTGIISSIFRQDLGRATFLNEAVIAAASAFARDKPEGRRAVVVVTDNETHRAAASDDDALAALHRTDAVLSAILIGEDAARPQPVRFASPANRAPDVRRLADATGGDVFSGADPAAALSRIIAGAVTRYSLHYAAPAAAQPGAFRQIQVHLSPTARRRHPGAVVQARTGYNLGPESKIR